MRIAVSRAPGEERAVTPHELFLDLVYVFAIGQLSQHLGRELARRGPAAGAAAARRADVREPADVGRHWEAAIAVLWIAGAIAGDDARLILWALAVVATQVGVATLHWLPGRGRAIDLQHTDIAGEHLLERFRLFVIIALGETVLVMGDAFAGEPFELERLLALSIGFTATVALWWC